MVPPYIALDDGNEDEGDSASSATADSIQPGLREGYV